MTWPRFAALLGKDFLMTNTLVFSSALSSETIEEERRHGVAALSLSDLSWSFAGQIRLADSAGGVLELTDAYLLGTAVGFQQLARELGDGRLSPSLGDLEGESGPVRFACLFSNCSGPPRLG